MVTQDTACNEIQAALERALGESNTPEKNYHIRVALQHVESIREGVDGDPEG